MSSPDHQRIMVIQLARMGDLLQTIPFLRALREKHPHSVISLLVYRQNAKLSEQLNLVDEVYLLDLPDLALSGAAIGESLFDKYQAVEQWVLRLRAGSFQTVYNLNHSIYSALIAWLLRPLELKGFAPRQGAQLEATDPWMSYLVNAVSHRQLSRINLADVFLGLLGRDFETSQMVQDFEPITLSSEQDWQWTRQWLSSQGVEQDDLLIAFQPGAGLSARQWPPESFAHLASSLIERQGAKILLLGREGEEILGQKIIDALGKEEAGRVINAIGLTNLGQLSALLQGCRLLVSNDTGTMHLAAYGGTPVLALFMGPACCFQTAPYGDGHLLVQASISCAPCTDDWAQRQCADWACHTVIDPDWVYGMVSMVLHGNQNGMLNCPPGVVLYRTALKEGWLNYEMLLPRQAEFLQEVAQCYAWMWRSLLGHEENHEKTLELMNSDNKLLSFS